MKEPELRDERIRTTCWPRSSGPFRKAFIKKKQMNNYGSFLLEAEAAKKRLAQFFEPEACGKARHRATAFVVCESSGANQTIGEHDVKTLPGYCRRTDSFVIRQKLRPPTGSQAN
jgi:hypothetical protein